jgi:hypothetical protein
MIKLFDNENDKDLGSISDSQLEFIVENLVEEALDEYTYSLNPSVISYLEGLGAEPELVGFLRRTLGNRNSMELRYEPD